VSDSDAIANIIGRINEAWRAKRYDEIGTFVADNVVIAPPTSTKRIHGRDTYVESYAGAWCGGPWSPTPRRDSRGPAARCEPLQQKAQIGADHPACGLFRRLTVLTGRALGVVLSRPRLEPGERHAPYHRGPRCNSGPAAICGLRRDPGDGLRSRESNAALSTLCSLMARSVGARSMLSNRSPRPLLLRAIGRQRPGVFC
jgi:hypothetical protein